MIRSLCIDTKCTKQRFMYKYHTIDTYQTHDRSCHHSSSNLGIWVCVCVSHGIKGAYYMFVRKHTAHWNTPWHIVYKSRLLRLLWMSEKWRFTSSFHGNWVASKAYICWRCFVYIYTHLICVTPQLPTFRGYCISVGC